MKLIDKSALVAEIEKLEKALKNVCKPNPFGNMEECMTASELQALDVVKEIINTFEVKEVDLRKEMDKEWNKCKPIDEGMGLEIASIEHEQFDNIAKHFFELGIKAQKGE